MSRLDPPRTDEASRSTCLAYWLCLALGLTAACLALEVPWARAWALVVGSVAGTGIGQLCARGRYRLWAAMILGATALFVVVVGLAIAQTVMASSDYGCLTGRSAALARDLLLQGSEADLALMAYVPAGLAGYLLVTEYGSIAALWFPLALWMLPILEPSRAPARSWVLVLVAAALLLVSLYTRERRRIAVWRSVGAVRLSRLSGVAVHRRAPLRPVYQTACLAGLGLVMLGVTGWLAPHLWQRETSASKDSSATPSTAQGGGGLPCCPSADEVLALRTREYFPLLSFHGADASAGEARCVSCGETASSASSSTAGAGSEGDVAAVTTPPTPNGEGGLESAPTPIAVPRSPVAASTPTKAQPIPPPDTTPLPQHAPPARPVASSPPLPPVVASSPGPATVRQPPRAPSRVTAPPPVLVKVPIAPPDGTLFGRALGVALLAFLSYLGVRPLRRWVTLKHLRRPLWRQSINEEISNGWQWILISLRDAGWEALPEERPRAFARRVAIEEVLDGATVLERARHGVRVSDADAVAMCAAARRVQSTVRAHLGRSARVVSWFRWPLV